jgi:hypothetical protein
LDLSEWSTGNTIERRSNLSVEEFVEKYEKPNIPVIITDVVRDWPAFKNWTREYLCAHHGNEKIKTDHGIGMTLSEYFLYSKTVQEQVCVRAFV